MKEHKYRAWDKEEKNFMYFNAIDGLKSECDETYIRLNVRGIDQYTGLKDKNGKEIYESDRVRLSGLNGTVVWDSATARFVLESDGRQTIKFQTISQMTKAQMEVIGNIYEEEVK